MVKTVIAVLINNSFDKVNSFTNTNALELIKCVKHQISINGQS